MASKKSNMIHSSHQPSAMLLAPVNQPKRIHIVPNRQIIELFEYGIDKNRFMNIFKISTLMQEHLQRYYGIM